MNKNISATSVKSSSAVANPIQKSNQESNQVSNQSQASASPMAMASLYCLDRNGISNVVNGVLSLVKEEALKDIVINEINGVHIPYFNDEGDTMVLISSFDMDEFEEKVNEAMARKFEELYGDEGKQFWADYDYYLDAEPIDVLNSILNENWSGIGADADGSIWMNMGNLDSRIYELSRDYFTIQAA